MPEELENSSAETSQPEEAAPPAPAETSPFEDSPQPTLAEMLMELVRERAKTEAKLTPMRAIEVEGKWLEPAQQEELVAQLLADERAGDLRLMRTSAGAAYLYSVDYLSDSYARILLRVEENNPYETIASTVREESEVYPRPTPLSLFRDPTFGLDPGQIEQLVEEMLQLPRYSDVRRLLATTGAVYLHSDRFLDHDWAESLVEWEEVGKYKSL